MKDLIDIAYKEGLALVDTTDFMSGYPQHIRRAIIGFDDFNHMMDVANRYDLVPRKMFKNEGWDLYCRQDVTDEPYDMEELYSNWPYTIFRKEDAEDFYDEEVRFQLEYCRNWRELESFIADKKEILEAIEDLEGDDFVVTNDGIFSKVSSKVSVAFFEDSKTYRIGLFDY